MVCERSTPICETRSPQRVEAGRLALRLNEPRQSNKLTLKLQGTSDAIGAGGNEFVCGTGGCSAPGASGSGLVTLSWTPFELPSRRLVSVGGCRWHRRRWRVAGCGESAGNGEPSGSTQPSDEAQATPPDDEPTTIPRIRSIRTTRPKPDGPDTSDYPPRRSPAERDTPVSVPEPATLGLLGFGIAAVGFMRRRRRRPA